MLAQSTVEFALIVPVLLLFLAIAIDFGRVYLGYINMQNVARIAANYAANNSDAWATPTDPIRLAAYQSIVSQDLTSQSCTIPSPGTVPAPTFADGTGNGQTDDLGDLVTVSVTCQFRIFTPIISGVFGNNGTLNVSASAVFPIKKGGISGVPGGGGGGGNPAPVADFVGSPLSGTLPAGGAGVAVTFTDLSTNVPTSWTWNFGDGNASNQQNPVHTYLTAGDFTVSLTARNASGFNTLTRTAYIHIDPTATGLNADFSANPQAGTGTPNLLVQFTDLSTGGATSWQWDFDSNGTIDSTAQSPSHSYSPTGSPYTVTLTVSDGTSSDSEVKIGYITVSVQTCVVPNVSDGSTNVSTALATINAANLVGVQDPANPNGNWKVRSQSPQGGLVVPCGSNVTVFK